MQKTYEAPRLTKVGSLKEMTLGDGWRGWDDSFIFYGIEIPMPGTPTS